MGNMDCKRPKDCSGKRWEDAISMDVKEKLRV